MENPQNQQIPSPGSELTPVQENHPNWNTDRQKVSSFLPVHAGLIHQKTPLKPPACKKLKIRDKEEKTQQIKQTVFHKLIYAQNQKEKLFIYTTPHPKKRGGGTRTFMIQATSQYEENHSHHHRSITHQLHNHSRSFIFILTNKLNIKIKKINIFINFIILMLFSITKFPFFQTYPLLEVKDFIKN